MSTIEKKHIITIAGQPGSGKSSAAKEIAKQFGYMHFSSGDLFRAIIKEQGIDVLQANLAVEQGTEISSIDKLVDDRLREIGQNEDEVVIDSRLAWHWIPQSFKVFLDLSLEEAARRILGNISAERAYAEHIPQDPAEYAVVLQKRLDSELRRYQKIYQVNPYDTAKYDLVINTATYNLEQVVELISAAYKLHI